MQKNEQYNNRISILISAGTKSDLHTRAQQTNTTVGHIVREAISSYLKTPSETVLGETNQQRRGGCPPKESSEKIATRILLKVDITFKNFLIEYIGANPSIAGSIGLLTRTAISYLIAHNNCIDNAISEYKIKYQNSENNQVPIQLLFPIDLLENLDRLCMETKKNRSTVIRGALYLYTTQLTITA